MEREKKTTKQLSFLEKTRRRAHAPSVGSKFQRGRLCPFFPTLSVASSSLLDHMGLWPRFYAVNLTCPSCNLVIGIQFLSFFLFSFFFIKKPKRCNLHCLHFNCLEMPSCFGSVKPQRRRLSQLFHWEPVRFSPKRTVIPISDISFWKQGYWFG